MRLLTLLALTTCCSADAQVFHLAARTDGRNGTGAASDPFDASTPAKLSRAWQKSAQTGASIVFLPGKYELDGDLALPARVSNVTVSGYGAQLSLAVKNLSGQIHCIRTDWNGNDGVTVEGFRIDAGTRVTFFGPGKTCGVVLIGRNCTVRDCVVRNIVSSGAANEAFGIILRGTNGTGSGNIVDGARTSTSGLVTGIALQGESVSASHNSVDLGDLSSTNAVTTFGYSLYGSRCVLSANTARRVDAGLSMDTAGAGDREVWRENVVIGNILAGTATAVRIHNGAQVYDSWVWVGNVFAAEGGMWLSMSTYNDAWKTNKVQAHSFVGNLFAGSPRQNNNLDLANFDVPHAFVGNRFTAAPTLFTGTNQNTIMGSGNTIQGKPSNAPFGVSELGR